jgi:Laminin N-terminal (Domain VI).
MNGKGLERRLRGLLQVASRHFYGVTEESHETFQWLEIIDPLILKANVWWFPLHQPVPVAGKAFDITYVRLWFYSPRPESFAIYKRTSEDGPWIPYQFYRWDISLGGSAVVCHQAQVCTDRKFKVLHDRRNPRSLPLNEAPLPDRSQIFIYPSP